MIRNIVTLGCLRLNLENILVASTHIGTMYCVRLNIFFLLLYKPLKLFYSLYHEKYKNHIKYYLGVDNQ